VSHAERPDAEGHWPGPPRDCPACTRETARLLREIFPGLPAPGLAATYVPTKDTELSWDDPDVVKRFREIFDGMEHEDRFEAALAVLKDRERLKAELAEARAETLNDGFDKLEAEDKAKQARRDPAKPYARPGDIYDCSECGHLHLFSTGACYTCDHKDSYIPRKLKFTEPKCPDCPHEVPGHNRFGCQAWGCKCKARYDMGLG
jgi:hypothetical protein